MGNRPRKKNNNSLEDLFFQKENRSVVTEHWYPSLDLCETSDEVIVRLEVPGVEISSLKVIIKNRTLKVSGYKKEPVLPENVRFICLERGYGHFQKVIDLEWVIDPRSSRASLKNGVLTIKLPKLVNHRGTVFEIPIEEE